MGMTNDAVSKIRNDAVSKMGMTNGVIWAMSEERKVEVGAAMP
jgi:hypothetical protein